MPADLIGATKAAELLGVSRVTVHRWAASGKLKVYSQLDSTNGSLLFQRSVVESLAKRIKK